MSERNLKVAQGVFFDARPRLRLMRAGSLRDAFGMVLRAPHHSCSEKQILEEICLAAGGVLLIDEGSEFAVHKIRIFEVVAMMAPAVRPILIVNLDSYPVEPEDWARGDWRATAQALGCRPAYDSAVALMVADDEDRGLK